MSRDTKAKGLEGAREIMTTILESINVGGEIVTPRTGDVSNKEILDFLAEGNSRSKGERIKRDIRINENDAEITATVFKKELAHRMRVISTALNRKGINIDLNRESRTAKQSVVSAMRKTLKKTNSIILRRVKRQVVNDGSKVRKVGEKYAKQRFREYGVGVDQVFYRTSQLADGLLNPKFRIEFSKYKQSAALAAVRKSIGGRPS